MNVTLPCLIIIDMQQGMANPAAGSRNNPQAEDNIAQLLQAWRAAQGQVVHVRHISRSPDSPFAPGQSGVAFQPALQPLPHEHVIEKNVPDAFINSALERWLRVRDLRRVVLVGVSTNNSVESSARTAGNLGFDTVVVSDATFAFAMRDYAGVQRSADKVHAMALANLMSDYATIQDTRSVLAELATTSNRDR
ncbi:MULTISPECIES: cysteine hydrolase family protein [unclassified Massilia]|uniref:cysteine hydrolase family protein n=1 Tax=unclassified Massilia TaxID=2609279 RepID=UPI001784D2CF|nr:MULTISPECIES: cysteine hydrolase family protein [unclassified Massilia]MBD8532715.1 cysteine hydrolase [Massilia sp. CFBP 13647]MBD8676076.1 cysteine hydrolase [Massilia sp. CFBP 13721]